MINRNTILSQQYRRRERTQFRVHKNRSSPTCNSASVHGFSDFQTGLFNLLLFTTCSGRSSNSLEQKQPIKVISSRQ